MDKYTELMQLSPDEAKQLIQAQGKDVYIYHNHVVVTSEYRVNRVRIYTDEFNKICLIIEG